MKKIVLALLIVGISFSVASANWLDIFKQFYSDKGIDHAVEKALEEGATPELIVKNATELVEFEDLNSQNLVKALYCAGISGKEIYEASINYEISEMIIQAGYEKSVDECKDQVVDSQAYTPTAQGGKKGFGGAQSTSSKTVSSVDTPQQ